MKKQMPQLDDKIQIPIQKFGKFFIKHEFSTPDVRTKEIAPKEKFNISSVLKIQSLLEPICK